MDLIQQHFSEARQQLADFVSREENFRAIEEAAVLMTEALSSGNKILACGNGGSLCDAMHFAEELSGRFRDDRPAYAALSLSDAAHITCTANDYGYKFIFSRQVEALGKTGDVLLAISTSGNSENITEAASAARQKGMKVVALTGKTGGKLAENCDVEIRAPLSEYSDRVQEIHIKVIHALIGYIEQHITPNKA